MPISIQSAKTPQTPPSRTCGNSIVPYQPEENGKTCAVSAYFVKLISKGRTLRKIVSSVKGKVSSTLPILRGETGETGGQARNATTYQDHSLSRLSRFSSTERGGSVHAVPQLSLLGGCPTLAARQARQEIRREMQLHTETIPFLAFLAFPAFLAFLALLSPKAGAFTN
jgi:hypothetical protein